MFVFEELFPAVVATLDDMTSWSGETAGKAAMCLRTLDNNFILAMEVLHAVLAVTKPLSVKLQGVAQDIHRATSSVRGCIEVLNILRNSNKFDLIFDDVQTTSGMPIEIPRLTSRQIHRNNAPADSPLEHFRRNMFYPFVDTCISQLQQRFAPHCLKASLLSSLIPAYCCDQPFESIKDGDLYR